MGITDAQTESFSGFFLAQCFPCKSIFSTSIMPNLRCCNTRQQLPDGQPYALIASYQSESSTVQKPQQVELSASSCWQPEVEIATTLPACHARPPTTSTSTFCTSLRDTVMKVASVKRFGNKTCNVKLWKIPVSASTIRNCTKRTLSSTILFFHTLICFRNLRDPAYWILQKSGLTNANSTVNCM